MIAPLAILGFFWLVVVVLMALVVVDWMRVRSIQQPQFFYEQKGEDTMADLLTYTIVAAPVVDGDVVAREFSVTVNGDAQPAQTYGAETTDFGVVTVPQDATVTLTLVDVDDAGNRSAPAVVEFVAADTIAPAQPGAITVTLVGEKTDTPNV